MTSAPAPPSGLDNKDGGGTSRPSVVPFDSALELSSLYDRLRRLETPTKENPSRWYSSEVFKTVLSGVILAAFGFLLTGRLEQSAKERELNTTNATEMQGLLTKVSTAQQQEANAAALALTAFGRYAIPPLVMELDVSTTSRIAAEDALISMGLTNQTDICTILGQVLDNRTQRYTAQSQTSVIRILGVTNCQTAVPALRTYEKFLKAADADTALTEYRRSVRDGTFSNVTTAKSALDTAFARLRANHAF